MIMQNETGFVPKKLLIRNYQSKPAGTDAAKSLLLAVPSRPPSVLAALAADGAPGNGAPYYDPRVADVLSQIASWAYSDYMVLTDALQHRSVLDPEATVSQISIKNEAMLVVATAFFIRSGDVGIVCFRGTEPSNAINFLTDASCRPVNFYSMGQVHGGFYRNVQAVWPDVAVQVEAAMSSGLRSIYVTGHSLGAAMAAIAGALIYGDAEYAHWRPLVRGIYTYGQPMVGDADFARSCGRFENLLFRHIYGHDLVPRLPPLTTGAFRHFGKEYHGDDKGWSPRSRLSTQLASISLSLPVGVAAWAIRQIPLLRWIRLPLSVEDHSPNNYLEGFRAARS